MLYYEYNVCMFGNDWGGIELIEKLNLMEMVEIG